jgi:hypothetical protein
MSRNVIPCLESDQERWQESDVSDVPIVTKARATLTGQYEFAIRTEVRVSIIAAGIWNGIHPGSSLIQAGSHQQSHGCQMQRTYERNRLGAFSICEN